MLYVEYSLALCQQRAAFNYSFFGFFFFFKHLYLHDGVVSTVAITHQ